MRVLVTGGTGVVGRPTVERLLARGHDVRLLSRHADRDAGDWKERVEGVPADVGDAASLAGAADGCGAVLHIAGIVAEDPPAVTFRKVHVEGTRNLIAESERAGVRRFVYVSSLGAESGSSDYHRSKRAAEELVRRFAGSWLVVRPGNVYGPGDEVISLLLKMLRGAPVLPVIGDGDQPFQPIWAGDLAAALALAVEEGAPSGQALELAGAEVTTTNQILDRLQEITATTAVRLPVPEWLARVGVGLARTLGLDLPIDAGQLTMLSEENVLDPTRPNALVELFGVTPTPLADGLRLLVDALPERKLREGRGDLRRHRYWADIEGSAMGPEELLRMVADDFASLPDPALLTVGVEPDSPVGLQEGETLTLEIPMRGHVQVRVEEVTPTAITAVTFQGHPLTGTIRFLTERLGDGRVRFEVRSYTRPSTLLDQVAMATLGELMKAATWRSTVQAVIDRSGGKATAGIQSSEEVLDERAMADVERWMDGLVRARRRREQGDVLGEREGEREGGRRRQ